MHKLTPNNSLNELHEFDNELIHWGLKKGQARKEHKYIKREWKNGRWRYYYDWDELKKDTKENIKNTANKTTEKTLANTTKVVNKNANTLIDKAKKVLNDLFTDPDNMYYMNKTNYHEKMAKVKESAEWKEIVASNDPEYVKKNADGTTTYLIDDYVVKKKHPVLDIASDIAAGRKADINAITKESTVAAIRDYGVAAVNMGMLATGIVAKALTEKFKFQQGTYEDDIQSLTSTINQGVDYAKEITDEAPTVSRNTVEQTADMIKVVKTVDSKTNATDTIKSINDGNVVKAAQVIMESETMQNALGSNEYYRMAESTLSNLSEEEIAALSLLLRQMYGK